MFCKCCGKENKDDAVFCKYCGKTIEKESENNKVEETASQIQEEKAICPRCGAPLYSKDSRFCKECGAEIEAVSDNGSITIGDSAVSNRIKKPFSKWLLLIPAVIILAAVIVFVIKKTSLSKEEIAETSAHIETKTPVPTKSPSPTPTKEKAETVVEESDESKDKDTPTSDNNEIYKQFVHDQIKLEDETFSGIYAYLYENETTPTCMLYDVDEDGVDELVVDGKYYGFDIYDVINGKLVKLAGGNGTAEMCNIYEGNGHVYVGYSDFTHVGRQSFKLIGFDGNGKEVETIFISADYWDSTDDTYDENSVFFYNGKETTMQEYEKVMTSYTPVPVEKMKSFGRVDVEPKSREESSGGTSGLSEKVIKAYEDYCKKSFPANEYGSYSYRFVYLDEDDTPELLVKAGFDMGEITILQYSDGQIYDLGAYIELKYIPRKNKIVDSWSDGETREVVKKSIEDHKMVSQEGVSAIYWDDETMKYYVIDNNDNRTEASKTDYDKFNVKIAAATYTSIEEEPFYSSVEEASGNIS